MNPATEMSPAWQVERLPLSGPLADIVSQWHLDSPDNGSPVTESEVSIRGWALGAAGHHQALHLVLRAGEETLSYPLMVERPDVIRHVYHEEPSFHHQLVCGFLHLLDRPLCAGGVTVGFEVDGVIHDAAVLRPTPPSA